MRTTSRPTAENERGLAPELRGADARLHALDAEYLERSHRGGWWYVFLAALLSAATPAAHADPKLPLIAWSLLFALAVWRSIEIARRRAGRVAGIAVAQGLIMGLLIAFLIRIDASPSTLALGLVFLCGMLAAGTAAMALKPRCHAIWLGGIALPVTLSILAESSSSEWALAIGVIVFCTYMYIQGRHIRDDVQRAHADAQLLRTAARDKRSILSHLSHDIRTPLAAVLGYLQLTRELDEVDPIRHCTATAEAQLRVSLALLNQLLDVAKMDFSHHAAEVTEFDAHELAAAPLAIFERAAHEKGLVFEHHVDLPEACRLSGAAQAASRALTNLLSNAVRYTEVGVVSAQLALLERDAGRTALRIVVEDSGPGISRGVLDRLYADLDSGAAEGLESAGGGDGLGLLGVARMMRSIGGTLDVGAREGGGTHIAAIVPVRRTTPVPAPVAESTDERLPTADRDTRVPAGGHAVAPVPGRKTG